MLLWLSLLLFIHKYLSLIYFESIFFLFLDSSLNDIKYVLNPIFTPDQIKQLDMNTKMSRAIDGTMYMPGIVGLNNIKANDYCNVILQVSED